MEPVLAVRGLSVAIRGKSILEDLHFRVAPGEVVGLIGLSGSGKSMTARAVLDILPPGSQGQGKIEPEVGQRGAMIFQEPLTALNPTQRCGTQLLEALRLQRPDLTTKAARRQEALRWLERVDLGDRTGHYLSAYPHQLSGGQRQRLLIAMALVGRPPLLFADEPTTALDRATEIGILQLLERLRQELGMAIVFITHDHELLDGWADRTLIMKEGRLTEDRSQFAVPPPSVSAPPADRAPASPPSSPIVLTVDKLTIRYGAHTVVEAFSHRQRAGEWVTLAGPSGSGKTSIARAIAGLLPHSGTVTVSGGVQMVYQDPHTSLNPRHRIGFALREAASAVSQRTDPAVLLASVGLGPEIADRRPAALSGGQRQRVAIARALAARPGLLICDEAVSGLDAPVRRRVLDLLNDLRRREGFAILFISHDPERMAAYSDRTIRL